MNFIQSSDFGNCLPTLFLNIVYFCLGGLLKCFLCQLIMLCLIVPLFGTKHGAFIPLFGWWGWKVYICLYTCEEVDNCGRPLPFCVIPINNMLFVVLRVLVIHKIGLFTTSYSTQRMRLLSCPDCIRYWQSDDGQYQGMLETETGSDLFTPCCWYHLHRQYRNALTETQ